MSFSITRDLINFLRYYILNIIKKNNNIIINSKMSEQQIKYVLEEINLIPKNEETKNYQFDYLKIVLWKILYL